MPSLRKCSVERRVVLYLVVCLLAVLYRSGLCRAQPEPDDHYQEICRATERAWIRCSDETVSTEDVEAELLGVLDNCRTDPERSIVLSKLANIFATYHLRIDREKSIAYAKRVLDLAESSPRAKAASYSTIGGNIYLMHRGAKGQELARVRREVAIYYLKGIRVLLDNHIGTEPLPEPSAANIGGMTLPSSDPEKAAQQDRDRKQRQREGKAAAEKLSQVREHNELVSNRQRITGYVVHMYQLFPFATEELEMLATDILQDKAAVDGLLAAVNRAVNARMGKEYQRVLQEVRPDLGIDIDLPAPETPAPSPEPTNHVGVSGAALQNHATGEQGAVHGLLLHHAVAILVALAVGAAGLRFLVKRRRE